jgi:hypothetical protein
VWTITLKKAGGSSQLFTTADGDTVVIRGVGIAPIRKMRISVLKPPNPMHPELSPVRIYSAITGNYHQAHLQQVNS